MGSSSSRASPSDKTNCKPNEYGWGGACWTQTNLPTDEWIRNYVKTNSSIGGSYLASLGCQADAPKSECSIMQTLLNERISKVNTDINNCDFNSGVVASWRCYTDNPSKIPNLLTSLVPWWAWAIGGLVLYKELIAK
jgi:hypothetical protein